MKSLRYHSSGFVMPIVLITVLFVMTMIAIVSSYGVNSYKLSTHESYRVNAQLAADAGIDVAINEINIDSTWTGSDTNGDGTPDEVTLLDTPNIRTTYRSELFDGASDEEKILSVVARTYVRSELKVERRYELDLQAVTSGTGPVSVVTGVGGLFMSNNAKITGGDVVVNGTINMDNNSQIGLSSTPESNAVNIRVSHTACPEPPDSTYPRVCASGENGEPITMGTTAKIYADVRATNQINSTNMFNPGLIAGESPDPIILPDYDRAGHQAAVVLPHRTPTESLIDCGNNQTKTWPANVKITGDIQLGNNCTVNLSGDTWITGKLALGNNAVIKIPESAGTTPPVIMIDGADGMSFGNNAQVQPNSQGTGGYFIAYWSTAACSPDCTDIVGADLKNSQNQVKISLNNNGSAPGSILYARWSRTRVYNNGQIGAVAGQSIELGNNAVINFTSSVPGSDNLTVTWVKRGYMRVYD